MPNLTLRWLNSLAALLLLIGCATAPTGVTPKPDISPVRESQVKVQQSVGKTREYVTKTRASEAQTAESIRKATESLEKYTGVNGAVDSAKTALKDAEAQIKAAQEYSQWADTELANAWKYSSDQKGQIDLLSGQIDVAHKNEETAVKYSLYAKPIIDQVNSYWGLGAFAYGFKVLSQHLFILMLVLGVVGVVVFFLFPAAIPLVAGLFGRMVSLVKGIVGSLFRKK